MAIEKDEMIKILREKNNKIQNDRDYWHREAITAKDQLGKVRLALGKIGITLEEVLEEAESMLVK